METEMVHRDHKVGSKGRDRDKDKGKDAITEPTSSLDLSRVDLSRVDLSRVDRR